MPAHTLPGTRSTLPPSPIPLPGPTLKLKGVAPLNQLCPSLDAKGRSVIKTR